MATFWTICGAGRGVGKTHLALKLREALPRSVYAKLGHGARKAGKPENYFQTEEELNEFVERHGSTVDHLIIESNASPLVARADIVIFVGRGRDSGNDREDVNKLRSNAHIHVSPGGRPRDWMNVLRAKLESVELREAICQLLIEQKRFVSLSGLSVRSKVWFVAGGEHVFGSGLAELLENIDRLGSLSGAAKVTRISYRRAWDLIKGAEKHLGESLIVPHPGGAGGGGSRLSPAGRRMLDVFKQINAEVEEFADARFAEHFGPSGNEK